MGLAMRRAACGAGSPARRASFPLLHGPILGRAAAMEAAQGRDLTDWEVLGDCSSSTETQQCSPVNLNYISSHWDWMVLHPLLPGNHQGYDFCFLWGCAKRDFVHLDLICSKLQYSVHSRLVFLLYAFYMLFHVSQWDVTQGKGRWNGWPPAKPSCHSPKSFPAWEAVSPGVSPALATPRAASALMLLSFRAGEIKLTLIHHYSDQTLFNPLLRSYLERDQFDES